MNVINYIKPESLFELAKQETGTRGHQFKIQKKHTRLKFRQNPFSIWIMHIWNSLPTVSSRKCLNNEPIQEWNRWCPSTTIDMYNYGIGRLWHRAVTAGKCVLISMAPYKFMQCVLGWIRVGFIRYLYLIQEPEKTGGYRWISLLSIVNVQRVLCSWRRAFRN